MEKTLWRVSHVLDFDSLDYRAFSPLWTQDFAILWILCGQGWLKKLPGSAVYTPLYHFFVKTQTEAKLT